MADLTLCVDCGGSATKIIYQLASSKSPKYLIMPPEVEEIPFDKLQKYFDKQIWKGNPAPIKEAWLQVEGKTFVVGDFASEFDPKDRIRELKYENALYKVLAAIGVIAQQHSFNTRKKLKFKLAILLPWNEYSDLQRFEGKLRSLIDKYQFRSSTLRGSLEQFLCRPEGGGLVISRTLKQGKNWFNQRRLAALMFGHRNTTALVFDMGKLVKGDSPMIGFSQMVDTVVSMTSGLDRNTLTQAIFKGESEAAQKLDWRYPNQGIMELEKRNAITELAQAKDESLRQSEIKDLVRAIRLATDEYWDKLKNWLDEVLPGSFNEVIISGGASYYLRRLLENYFNCYPKYTQGYVAGRYKKTVEYSEKYNVHQRKDRGVREFTPIVWGSGITDEVDGLLSISWKDETEKWMKYRLIDAFSLFNYLLELEG